MMRQRYSSQRVARILGWTTVAVTWGATVIARGLGAPAAGDAVPQEPSLEPALVAAASSTSLTFPDEPDGGLVIIRGTAIPNPEPVTVVRRVVVAQASQSAPITITTEIKKQKSEGS